jgi:alpha-tubulin suppressor-like RCC1 family protein
VVVSAAAGPPTAPPPPSNPVVATSSLTPMAVGKPAVRTLSATSGTGPYTWSVASGALPAGLSLVPTGVVSGTPLTVAVTSFTVRVTDALGHSGTGSVTSTVRPVVVRAWGTNGYDELGSDGGDPDTIVTTAAPNSTSAVAGGFRYALVLETDGSVWAWGANDQGELGLGDTQSRNVPTKIAGLSNIVAIAAGRTSAYAVSAAGLVYAWGANGSGEIGDGYTIERHTPVNLPTLTNIVSVAAGDRFALALDASGRVHSWGRGDNGVLGNGLNTTQQTTPVLADPFISPAVAISASSTASYAVLADGTVNAWGLKEHGQLGHVQPPVAAPDDPSPVPVDGLTGVTALSCTGFEFCLALRHDGSVWAWGYGMYGEMGNGATSDGATAAQVPGLSDVVAVATANQTGFALRGTGTVSSWGYDHHNALGSGDPNDLGTLSPATIPGLTEVVGLGAGYENGYALQAG